MNHPSIMNDGERNLFQLIEMNDIDGLTRLLQHNTSTGTRLDMNCFHESGFTPLMDAANRNNTRTEIITILIEYGADINIRSSDRHYQNTALHFACEHGNLNTVKLLLLHGANPNDRNKYYVRSLLHNACFNYKVDLIKTLLEFKADCNCQDNVNWTPLHFAVSYGIDTENADLLQPVLLLLDYGADVNIQNNVGGTPLHLVINAIFMKYNFNKIPDRVLMIIQLLLESHSNINVELEETFTCAYKTLYKGDTPLHCAVRFEFIDIVKMILEFHPKSFHVETALNIAKTNLESVPLTENDRNIRLQNIVDCIEVWRRQQMYLYLLNRWGIQK